MNDAKDYEHARATDASVFAARRSRAPLDMASHVALPAPTHRRTSTTFHVRASDGVSRRAIHRGSVAVVAVGGVGDAFAQLFNAARTPTASAAPLRAASARGDGSSGATNTTVRVVNGMKHKRLGNGDIVVSELGLGTQRWGGADANSPDAATCEKFMDYAILERGVSLIDTAEQYPIPSDRTRREGRTEEIIGAWMKRDKARRDKCVLATKITGGANVTPKNIIRDLEGSLMRLGTDYVDVYNLHWPARYTPQSNWGQSLMYHVDTERAPYYKNATSFEDICEAMGKLIAQGKIRGYGSCNDNAYGLTAMCYAARAVGAPEPCNLQGDFSLINRRAEENGVSEAASPVHENVGWMGYNILAGGVLTGKYMDVPAAVDNANDRELAERLLANPRGRMDDYSWGKTLYRYRSAPALRAAAAYNDLAKASGMSLTELAIRWARQRTMLTTALIGHTSMEQLEQTVDYFDAELPPLDADLAWAIDRVHMRNRLPIFSSERVGQDWDGAGEIGERIP